MALCDQLEEQQETSITAHQTLVEALLAALTNASEKGQFDQAWARIAEHFNILFPTEHSIDQLKQTILQLAVMGKLVPQDPNDEPASVLLEKIAAEKEQMVRDGKIKKQKKLPEIEESEKPFELPDGWEWANLEQLYILMDAGWSPACLPDPSPDHDSWGVLKTTAVQAMKYLEEENKALPNNKEPRQQYEVNVGDVLITRAGPKNRVGVACTVKLTRPRLMISDKIIRIEFSRVGVSAEYAALCLNFGGTADFLEAAKSGMAASQMNISQAILKSAPIPLPPVNEQARIAKKVSDLISVFDRLKCMLDKNITKETEIANLVTSAIADY